MTLDERPQTDIAREDILRFVEMHLTVQARSGNELSVLCPSHGESHASMRINVAKGVFLCHGCGIRGGIGKLGRLVGIPFAPDNPDETRLAMLQGKLAALRKTPEEMRERVLPESTLLRYRMDSAYWSRDRGLTDETIRAFDLGYDPMDDCVTIPIRNHKGELLGVTRRFLDAGHKGDRYKDPKGFRKADNLFGSWLAVLDGAPTVVLNEGPIDAMKVWQAGHAAVAQFGSYITPRQIQLLRKEIGALVVVLFYDNDEGGRRALEYSKGFTTNEYGRREYNPDHDLRRFFVVRKVSYRCGAKDPGELTDAQIDQRILNSTLVR